jgi:segregation and condensation protein A
MADLLDALREVLNRIPETTQHDVIGAKISIADRIPIVMDFLREGDAEFARLFPAGATRIEVVTTFLAILELVRLGAVRVVQPERFGPICLSLAVEDPATIEINIDDSYKD